MRAERFPILFTGANPLMAIIGILPSRCRVELDDDEMRVQLSWAFQARVPRASIGTASAYDGRVYGWGAHGWRGRWLVNGSSRNIVQVPIDPPARASVMGFPVRLSQLAVSVVDRGGFLAALNGRGAAAPR